MNIKGFALQFAELIEGCSNRIETSLRHRNLACPVRSNIIIVIVVVVVAVLLDIVVVALIVVFIWGS